MKPLVLLFIFLLSFHAKASIRQSFPKLINNANYTLEDLEALKEKKNFYEFFSHALDIRPSNRDSYWEKMVAQMAENYASISIEKEQFDHQRTSQMLSLIRWPALKDEELFRYRSDKYMVKSLKLCGQNQDAFPKTCIELYKQFSKLNPHYNAVLELIPIVHEWSLNEKYLQSKAEQEIRPSATKLMLESAKNPLAEFYCGKMPYSQLISQWIQQERPSLKKVQKQMHKDCWESFAKAQIPLLEEVSPLNEPLFSLLNEAKLVPKEKKDFFLVQGLLSHTFKNDLYRSMSWNHLNLLAQSHTRREKVAKKLENSPFMPDQALKSLDTNKREQLLRHLKKNFPEFLDIYAKKCLTYLKGEINYPRGNPTLHCPIFFKQIQSQFRKDPVLRGHLQEYQKLKSSTF